MLLARSLTTLDCISAGRLDVGLGLGWSIDEYEAAGVANGTCGAARGDARRARRGLGSRPGGDTASARQHRGVRIVLKPVQGPPPLFLSVYTPAGLDRVARRADGWNPAGLPVDALEPMWRVGARPRPRPRARSRGASSSWSGPTSRSPTVALGATARLPRHVDQVADDLDATRAVGADEVVLGLLDDSVRDPRRLLDVYGAAHDRGLAAAHRPDGPRRAGGGARPADPVRA